MIGTTALSIATDKGHVETVGLLLAAGCDKELASDNGRTPLMRAAAQGKLECVRLFIESGACKTAMDQDGSTALRLAVDGGHHDVAALLRQ